MPRKSRIDFPGALHHVIGRGINGEHIFREDKDKTLLLERIEILREKNDFALYAWCVMDNHFHLLLQTGNDPLSSIMKKLLTGYAVNYNRQRGRTGHLFQNRYKSILCDKDEFLLRLIRYIHLNPVKAGIRQIDELDKYPWTSHRDYIQPSERTLVERDETLTRFGSRESIARSNYKRFIHEGVHLREDLSGGGLRKSVGKTLSEIKRKDIQLFDDRVLGNSHFVKKVLQNQESELNNFAQFSDWTLDDLVVAVETSFEISPGGLQIRDKHTKTARDIFIFLGKMYLNRSLTELGEVLGIKKAAASVAFHRGNVAFRSMDCQKILCREAVD